MMGVNCVCVILLLINMFVCCNADVDECLSNLDECDMNADCTNTDLGYSCSCKAGYEGDGFICKDVNECTNGQYQCDINAQCKNTAGGYYCECNTYYTGDGLTCTVDPTWSNWNGWGSCSVTCGQGSRTRSRTCKLVCIGAADIQEQDCFNAKCPINPNWNNWGEWETCSVTCGRGSRKRSRTCNSPDETNTCTGESIENQYCFGANCPDVDECLSNLDECDMNANCTNTDLWYSCSCKAGYEGDGFICKDVNECTNGQHQCDINAQCKNTAGGYYCECNTYYTGDGLTCTVIPTWSNWDGWGSCSVTCGQGSRIRSRTCKIVCPGANIQEQECFNAKCPINPNWNNWGEWETCSVTCGRGSRKRSRTCNSSDETNTCTGDGIENQDCLEADCPVNPNWNNWGEWETCPVTCGRGSRKRSRTCNSSDETNTCTGDGIENQDCLEADCPVSPNWNNWGEWETCSVTCGRGSRKRSRTCNSSDETNTCTGDGIENQDCLEVDCPVNPNWNNWGEWETCSVTCGRGSRKRSRTCNSSDETNTCTGDGIENQDCLEVDCPVTPNWKDWGEWETCSVTCGRGSRKRSRTCNSSDETNTCTGDSIENQDCLEADCPVDTTWTNWGGWGSCSVTCGQGSRTRSRTCKLSDRTNTERTCTDANTQEQSCFDVICPILCSKLTDSYGVWPETKVGLSTTLPCLYSYLQGAITRECGYGGHWGEVQNKCYVNDTHLIDLYEQILELLDPTAGTGDPTGVVTSVVDELENITENVENFKETSKVIEYTVKIAMSVNTVYQDSDTAVTDDISEDLIGALSNIIDPDFEIQWTYADGVKGSEVLETLDELLKMATEKKCNELKVNQIIDVDKEHIYAEIGNTSTGITFPKTALRQGSGIELRFNLGLSTVCYNGALYSTLLDFVEEDVLVNGAVESFAGKMKINSDIISIQLADQENMENLDPPTRITLAIKDTTFSDPMCVYWDFDITNDERNGAWSGKGCNDIFYNRTHVVCSCIHLTNFAILMSPSPVSAAHTKALSIISAVGCVISMTCLVLTIIVHCLVWRLVRSDRVVILMNLCVALLLALCIFLAGVNRTQIREVCVVIAALIQLLFLAVFFFMLLIGIEILICVVHVFMTKFRIKLFIPLAWFLPVLIVGISLGVTKTKGYGNDQFCWLDTDSGLIWAFIGPAAFVILVNFIIMLIVFKKMASSHFVKSKSTKVKVQTGLRSMCVLVPVMGLTWVMGILSVNSDLVAFQYLFSIFNTLQGLFIFLFHCVFNRQIRDALKQRNKRRRTLQTLSSD